MLDLKRDVVVRVGAKEVYRGRPEQRLSTLLKTSWNGDPGLQFAVEIPVSG